MKMFKCDTTYLLIDSEVLVHLKNIERPATRLVNST